MTTTEFAAERTLESPSLICCAIRSTRRVGRPITREDLREYALDYYEPYAAFSTYLQKLALRLDARPHAPRRAGEHG